MDTIKYTAGRCFIAFASHHPTGAAYDLPPFIQPIRQKTSHS